MAGDLVQADAEIFNTLLFLCQQRGEDSTGVFSVRKTAGAIDFIKQVGRPDQLMAMKRYDDVIRPFSSRAIIGHCRKATLGKVNVYNAHPFHVGNVIGVHNGSLRGSWPKLPTDGETYEVDSNALIAALGQRDPKEVLEEVEGAFALIWYNQSEDTLYLARNDERPLWYCYSENKRKIFWASEYQMLDYAMSRTKTKLFLDEEGHGFFPVPKNKIIGLALSSKTGEAPITQRHIIPFQPKERSWGGTLGYGGNFRNHGGNGNPSGRLSAGQQNQTTTNTSNIKTGTLTTKGTTSQPTNVVPFGVTTTTKSAQSNTEPSSTQFQACLEGLTSCTDEHTPESTNSEHSPSSSNVVGLGKQTNFWASLEENNDGVALFDNEVTGPGGIILNETQFAKLVSDGCQFCQQTIDFADEKAGRGVHHWVDSEHFICVNCIPNKEEGHNLLRSVVNS